MRDTSPCTCPPSPLKQRRAHPGVLPACPGRTECRHWGAWAPSSLINPSASPSGRSAQTQPTFSRQALRAGRKTPPLCSGHSRVWLFGFIRTVTHQRRHLSPSHRWQPQKEPSLIFMPETTWCSVDANPKGKIFPLNIGSSWARFQEGVREPCVKMLQSKGFCLFKLVLTWGRLFKLNLQQY